MTELRLHQELEDSKAEIAWLRERLATTLPTVHKDISLVPKWSDAETATRVEEFLASIEGAAKIARWDRADCLQIATLRPLDPARAFFNSSLGLQAEDATWEKLKKAFRERFKDAHIDQYHFLKLQTAKQEKGERPQEFADRCKNLAQKVMRKVNDPMGQRIHRENTDRICFARYVSGLCGNVGKLVQIQNPQTIQQALTKALAVTRPRGKRKSVKSFSRDPTSTQTQRIGKTQILYGFMTRASRNKSSHSTTAKAKRGEP